MSDNNFIEQYMNKCLIQGKTSILDIVKCAQQELECTENEIKKIELLRVNQNNLRALIKQLSPEAARKNKVISTVINTSVSEDELPDYIKTMCVKICNFLESNNKPVTNRELMDSLSSVEENKMVLISIKWLWEQGIITKNEKSLSREITPGPHWDRRPK